MACGLSTEMELELESIGVWGETITGIPGEKTLREDLLKEPTANSTHAASTRLKFHMQVNLPAIEFLGTRTKPACLHGGGGPQVGEVTVAGYPP